MFSNRIANSAKFLQMPAESQLLYFHMILRADDDGIVESYPLMKLLGTNTDAFKVLIVKGYIKPLNEDQVVVIEDWLEHNNVRSDRKVDSLYKNLLLEKYPDFKLIEAKPRADVEDNSKRLGGQSTDGLGKVRLGEVKKEEISDSSESHLPSKPNSIQEEQDITYVSSDDEGYISPITKKKPADKTFQMNANKLRQYFIDRCIEDLGTTPVIMAPMVYKLTKAAMDHHKLTWVELKNVVDEWFDNPIHKDKVNFAWMLGPMHLNKWRMDNPK